MDDLNLVEALFLTVFVVIFFFVVAALTGIATGIGVEAYEWARGI